MDKQKWIQRAVGCLVIIGVLFAVIPALLKKPNSAEKIEDLDLIAMPEQPVIEPYVPQDADVDFENAEVVQDESNWDDQLTLGPVEQDDKVSQPEDYLVEEAVDPIAEFSQKEAKPLQVAEPKVVAQQSIKPKPAPQAKAPIKEPEKPRAVVGSYSLQVGGFAERENADKLAARLSESGLEVFVRQKSNFSKVYVGRQLTQEQVEKLKNQIKEKYQLNGFSVSSVE
jgi:cell division septation protein DedD